MNAKRIAQIRTRLHDRSEKGRITLRKAQLRYDKSDKGKAARNRASEKRKQKIANNPEIQSQIKEGKKKYYLENKKKRRNRLKKSIDSEYQKIRNNYSFIFDAVVHSLKLTIHVILILRHNFQESELVRLSTLFSYQ
jgi:hypothetical protein